MKLVLPYAQNVRELLRIEEQFGDPNALFRTAVKLEVLGAVS